MSHRYAISLEWTGNRGSGTRGYRDYARDHVVRAPGKPDIAGSSDPGFRGDAARWNPEELLVMSLSQCHMLWVLHLASEKGVEINAYSDDAEGEMATNADGGGQFTRVMLRPRVTLAAGDTGVMDAIHHRAHELCFIARSVNFPVECEGEVVTA